MVLNKEAILTYALRIIALDYKYRIPFGYKPYEFAQLVLEFVKEDLNQIPDEMVIQQFESDLMTWLKQNRIPAIEKSKERIRQRIDDNFFEEEYD